MAAKKKKAGKGKAKSKAGRGKTKKAAPTKAAKKKAVKAKPKKVSAIPADYPRISSALNVKDPTVVIDFCKKVFGAKVRNEMRAPDGSLVHAELKVGDSVVLLSEAVREPVQTGALMVYVASVDKSVAVAVDAGATVVNAAQDMFWGDRMARVRDSQGNHWTLGTHIEDVSAKETRKRLVAFAARMTAAGAAAASAPTADSSMPALSSSEIVTA